MISGPRIPVAIAVVAVVAVAALAGCSALRHESTSPPELDVPPGSAASATPQELARWWTAFGDPVLDRLVGDALAANLDVQAAIARVDAARAQVKVAQRDQYPTVDIDAGATRNRTSQATAFVVPGFPAISNDYKVELHASYEVDLWGKYRTATGAARRELLASEFARETVRTVVAADTARMYFNLLAADAQLSLLEETLKTRDKSVELQKDRYDAGVIGDYDLGTAQAERDSVAADIEIARRSVVEFESALAVLVGRSPREVFTPQIGRNVAMAWGTAVPQIPSGLPSDLLARRPDIRQAEAQLAAASMRIDVARADYFPAVSLTGALGTEAAALRNLFSGPAAIWSIGAALVQPLVGLKAVEANVEAKTAARNEQIAAYTKVVQGAFHDAHDALSANQTTRAALAAQSQRKDKLAVVVEMSDMRYRSGYSPYLEVLDAQRQLLAAETQQIMAARNVRLAVVDIAKALGGGWDSGQAPELSRASAAASR